MRKATGDALSPGLQWNKMALKQNQKLQVISSALRLKIICLYCRWSRQYGGKLNSWRRCGALGTSMWTWSNLSIQRRALSSKNRQIKAKSAGISTKNWQERDYLVCVASLCRGRYTYHFNRLKCLTFSPGKANKERTKKSIGGNTWSSTGCFFTWIYTTCRTILA